MAKNNAMALLLLFGFEFLLGVVEVKANESSEFGNVIGIDFGMTYSCVSVYDYKKDSVLIIAGEQVNSVTPSWVAFTDMDHVIGEAAKNQQALNAERTIFNFKRLMGRKFEDVEVQRILKLLPYKVVNKDAKPYIEVRVKGENKVFSPEEISAMVLKKMKETAEDYLGKKINNAVVTVPVYWNDAQRQAVKDAGTIAGLNVARIIDEPIAAAIAYGLNRKEGGRSILVYHLGGGTIDVSIFIVHNGALIVLGTNGDTHLGGEDFNHRLTDYFIQLIERKYNKDIRKDYTAVRNLQMECERAKRALSSQNLVHVKIRSLFDGTDFSEPLTRTIFEQLNMDLFNKTMELVTRALEDARLNKTEIDDIVLVGGSTRIPKVQQLLVDFFDGKELNKGINPDEAVTIGASIQGRSVAIGAAIQGSRMIIFEDETKYLPCPLDVISPWGTTIPSRKTQIFTTYKDQQTTVSIKVFEGECYLTKDYLELGMLDLSRIPSAPRGMPLIEVTIEVEHVNEASAFELIKITINKERLIQKDSDMMLVVAKELPSLPEVKMVTMSETYTADARMVTMSETYTQEIEMVTMLMICTLFLGFSLFLQLLLLYDNHVARASY